MYKLKRLLNMNYGQFFETLRELKRITKRNYVVLLLDVLYCAIKFEAGYIDYKVFEMYKYSNNERSTFITRGDNNKIVKHYNNTNFKHLVGDKIEFNKLFTDYLGRGWLDLRECSFDDFKAFCSDKDFIFVKPTDQICGKGIEKLPVKNIEKLYKEIKSKGLHLIEEVATQHPLLTEFNPTSINTLRLVTINNGGKVDVLFGILRVGNGSFVDNLNQGGFAAPIDVLSGVVRCDAATKSGQLVKRHPLSNKAFKGFKIPMYSDCVKTVKEAAKLIPEVGYLGWDVYVTQKGCGLIEANFFPGHDLYQLPGQLIDQKGVKPFFKQYINFL